MVGSPPYSPQAMFFPLAFQPVGVQLSVGSLPVYSDECKLHQISWFCVGSSNLNFIMGYTTYGDIPLGNCLQLDFVLLIVTLWVQLFRQFSVYFTVSSITHPVVSLKMILLWCVLQSALLTFHLLFLRHCECFSYASGFLLSGLVYAWTLDHLGVQTLSRQILLWDPPNTFHLVLRSSS